MQNGDQVLVEYIDLAAPGYTGFAQGTLGACVDGANVVTQIVVETDGGATFIDPKLVTRITVEA